MLNNDLIRKILLYNIHPVAEILKDIFKKQKPEYEKSLQRRTFFEYIIAYPVFLKGCHHCHKLVNKKRKDKKYLIGLSEYNGKTYCV